MFKTGEDATKRVLDLLETHLDSEVFEKIFQYISTNNVCVKTTDFENADFNASLLGRFAQIPTQKITAMNQFYWSALKIYGYYASGKELGLETEEKIYSLFKELREKKKEDTWNFAVTERIHWDDPGFQVFVLFYTLHELAHIFFNHEEDTIPNEYEADMQAWKWLREGCINPNLPDSHEDKMDVYIQCVGLGIVFFEAQSPGLKDTNTHPSPKKRFNNIAKDFQINEDHPVYALLAGLISLIRHWGGHNLLIQKENQSFKEMFDSLPD